ncbi:MAG: hypothetical protein ABSF32_02005 [Ignavibacteria bacterium]|jgi:hypothetical protein
MLKKLFTLSLMALTLMILSSTVRAQTIYFCEDVDRDGYAIHASDVFNISRDGGYLKVLVRLPYTLGCRSVSYEIYRNGDYDNTIYQDTERDWVWFYKEITFYKAGNFSIDVYDSYGTRLVTGYVKIQFY